MASGSVSGFGSIVSMREDGSLMRYQNFTMNEERLTSRRLAIFHRASRMTAIILRRRQRVSRDRAHDSPVN
jgi:hypothetical protein